MRFKNPLHTFGVLAILLPLTGGNTFAAPIEQDVFTVQILKDGQTIFKNGYPILAMDGGENGAESFQVESQLRMTCVNGMTQQSSEDRANGAAAVVGRSGQKIKAAITIQSAAPQANVPGHIEKCTNIVPKEQVTFRSVHEFNVNQDGKSEFTKEIGNGYTLKLTAIRFVR